MKNKYNAIKTTVDGIKFDSKKEAACYEILKEYIVELQPRFVLERGFKHIDKTHRKIEYIADFVVKVNDIEYIIDVKGFQTAVFKIKYKLFLIRYPDKILLLIKDKKEALSLKLNLDKEKNLKRK